MSILVADHLKKYYGEGETLVKALDDVSLSVERGEFLSIIGTSGSGKSTLLHKISQDLRVISSASSEEER